MQFVVFSCKIAQPDRAMFRIEPSLLRESTRHGSEFSKQHVTLKRWHTHYADVSSAACPDDGSPLGRLNLDLVGRATPASRPEDFSGAGLAGSPCSI